jgi:hypothetical protein
MSDLTTTQAPLPPYHALKSLFSAQTVRRFLGLVFAFSSIGLWLAPGSGATADVLLLKTGLTGVLTFCAIVALLPRV